MNVNTLVISAEEATRKLDQYRSITGKRRLKEDEYLQSLYKSVTKGGRVVNILEAFKLTGLNELGQPRLAIARADAQDVFFRSSVWLNADVSRPVFGSDARFNELATTRYVALPNSTFGKPIVEKVIRSPVPHIPPSCRPRFGLHNYHILFEVEKWETYPVDPFLLRRISGFLYVVEAEWNLTPLEAALLGSMRGVI